MQTLGLNPAEVTTRFASEFPDHADLYVCDKCGRDLTKCFYPLHSHSRRPFGPPRFTCACGQRYLSGAAEWDERSRWEQRGSLRDILFGAAVLSALAILSLLIYFLLHRHPITLACVTLVLLFPFGFMAFFGFLFLVEVLEVAASLIRTRLIDRIRT